MAQIQTVKLQWNARSKIGSLENANHKPGGGDKKIETKKIEVSFHDGSIHVNPSRIQHESNTNPTRLINAWCAQVVAKSKIGSLQNANYKPGGGDKKIETRKIEFQAKSKVGSTVNMKHVAGGGNVKVPLLFTSVH